MHVPGGLATKPNLCQNSFHSTLQISKKVCHFDWISMSMTFAPDIPHSRPPGRDVGTGQTVSRVPLSRVMVPEQFAKFVHMLFAVCLLVFVCLQPQDSIPGLPGERVAQGRTLTRGPSSRVMNKKTWTKFVHWFFVACLWVCVCLQPQDSIPGHPQHIAKTKKKYVILARFCHGHEYAAFQAPGGCACAWWFTQFCLHMAKLPGQFSHFHRLSPAFGCFSILVKFFDFCNGVVCVCVYVACNL